MKRILMIEADDRTVALLRCRFQVDCKVKAVASIEAASDKLARHKFDLIVWNGAEEAAAKSLEEFSARAAGTRMIILADPSSSFSSKFDGARICVKDRSISDEELASTIENQILLAGASSPPDQLIESELNVPIQFEGLIAVGLPMRAVIRQIMDAAAVDIPVQAGCFFYKR